MGMGGVGWNDVTGGAAWMRESGGVWICVVTSTGLTFGISPGFAAYKRVRSGGFGGVGVIGGKQSLIVMHSESTVADEKAGGGVT